VPTYTLHHLVKERYPRFMDALGDVDDALTLAHLFAALPGEGDIKPGVTNKAKTLVAAWGAYCATTSSITKSFISVKGVYTEASIRGSTIRWVVPHSFTQYLPEDVDYRVMMTFFEFYETLLNFVLYKLYNEIGVRYPFPLKDIGGETIGSTSSVLGANLRALRNALDSSKGAVSNVVSAAIQSGTNEKEKATKESGGKQKSKELVKSVGAALSKLTGEDSDVEEENDDDSVDVQGPLQAALENMAEEQARASVPGAEDGVDDDALKRRRLFEGLTFFLSREVPRGYLELVCLAYGGKVGWEGDDSPISMKDVRITHHIVDRPQVPGSYDTLPKSREYVQPQWILDCANFMFLLPIARYAAGAELPPHLSPWVDDEEEGYKPAYAEEIERIKNGESVEPAASLNRGEEDVDEEMEEGVDVNEDEEEEEEEDSEEEEDNEEVRQKKERKRKKDEQEVHDLAKTVMSRKASHLYGRMQHGIAAKQSKVQNLKDRRKDIEMTKEKDGDGRTVLKQKYDRVKKERKILNDTYTDTGGSMKKSKKAKNSS
jgi:pescadillo protein